MSDVLNTKQLLNTTQLEHIASITNFEALSKEHLYPYKLNKKIKYKISENGFGSLQLEAFTSEGWVLVSFYFLRKKDLLDWNYLYFSLACGLGNFIKTSKKRTYKIIFY